nr:hypothetical protein Itr_chr12CG29000 [Ipomoea trifida]
MVIGEEDGWLGGDGGSSTWRSVAGWSTMWELGMMIDGGAGRCDGEDMAKFGLRRSWQQGGGTRCSDDDDLAS